MSEDIPKISIFMSAYRPQNWMYIYDNIGDNDTTFEIIFVGPNEPNFKLPSNCRFIKTMVKPVQCYEIGARNARGDLIINYADDIEFKLKKPIDKLYNVYKSHNDDKLIASCVIVDPGMHPYFNDDATSPLMPVVGLMSRKLYIDIGGADINFVTSYWDLDVALRIYALGGRVLLNDDIRILEFNLPENWNRYQDRQYLDSLWTVNRKVHFNRARPLEPFSDNGILETSQGRKGIWI